MKKVNEDVWKERMNNLMQRRATGYNLKNPDNNPAGNYKLHLEKVKVGESVLDVGCGFQIIKSYLKPGVKYVGIDPFPCISEAVEMKMEDCTYENRSFDTVICFAVLDGVNNFTKTMEQVARVCAKNVVILTGVNIPVDKYHTFELTENEIDISLPNFKRTYREELGSRKVLLLEYTRL